jgi:hypothetical protein
MTGSRGEVSIVASAAGTACATAYCVWIRQALEHASHSLRRHSLLLAARDLSHSATTDAMTPSTAAISAARKRPEAGGEEAW